ncbi:MAG TPA: ABC transporter permease, partial [Gemmataceae bacterium]
LLGDERFWLVFLFIPPLLTMRLFAEERGTGTLEVLMTAPVRDWQVVAGKFIACFGFYLVLWLPTLAYLPALLDVRATWQSAWTPYSIAATAGAGLTLLVLVLAPFAHLGRAGFALFLLGVAMLAVGLWGHSARDEELMLRLSFGIDPWPALTSYVGVVLAGAMFLALGLFVSSLVNSQLVAAIVSLVLSLPFVAVGFWQPELESGSLAYQLVYFFSVPLHFRQDFTRGVIDTRHLVLYASVTLFFLFLTVRSLEARRWK